MESSSTWIVVPCFNEAAVIASTIRSLAVWQPNIVVVDDGSSDNTARQVQSVGAHLVRHAINLGQGAALMTGVRFALAQGAHFIVTFDADGQHSPHDIPKLLAAARHGGVDVVLGSRFLKAGTSMPQSRRWLLKAATLYTKLTTGLSLTDSHNGIRLLTRQAAERLQIRQDRMAHASELLGWISRSELRVTEVPVDVAYTDYSLAKGQNAFSSFGILWDLWSRKLHR